MCSTYRLIGVFGCLIASLWAGAQAVGSPRKIVLPNPKQIHCHSATCSQLWTETSLAGEAVYPAQVLTDRVKWLDRRAHRGLRQIRIDYGNPSCVQHLLSMENGSCIPQRRQRHQVWVWRVEPERLAIRLSERNNGVKQLTYLKFGTFASHVPSARMIIDDQKGCR
jgi:hypothetical protein